MWKLEHISAINFISFKTLELDIQQGVCTLLFGENYDNENQKNNGSGKSTIVEAIAFGITGESIKKAPSINDIINDYEEEVKVCVTLSNSDNLTTFIVERQISRSGAQQIVCRKTDSEGNEIEKDRTTQPSVNDYNKYILEEIGVTKEQLYSCYLLNNARFKSFFLATDKEKKEIINNFSNGVLVDEAIDKLHQDIEPVKLNLDEANNSVLKAGSGLCAIEEQIEHAEQTKEQARQNKELKISELKNKIAEKRATIRNQESNIDKANDRLDDLEDLQKKIKDLSEKDSDFNSAYQTVKGLFAQYNLANLDDYTTQINDSNTVLDKLNSDINIANKSLQLVRKESDALKSAVDKTKQEYERADKKADKSIKDTQANIQALEKTQESIDLCLQKLDQSFDEKQRILASIKTKITKLNAQINGAVTCPKCKHQFLLDSNADLDELKQELERNVAGQNANEALIDDIGNEIAKGEDSYKQAQQQIKDLNKEIDAINKDVENERNNYRASERSLEDILSRISSMERNISSIEARKEQTVSDINNMRSRMFTQASSILETAITKGNNYLDYCDNDIVALEEAIDAYKMSIMELEKSSDGDIMESLKVSKKNYEDELSKAKQVQYDVQKQYDELISQEDYFIRFKSYLANTKIDAIASEVNNFLGKIGSDLTIELSGYKVLKNKKVREKITMDVLRDGVNIGSLEKLSGGERNRIMLAGILAMQHLTNINCEDEKGLELLVIDEVLEASDYSGLMSYTDALNDLGVTALLVTQNAVSEGYPYQLLVRKEGGLSSII